MTFRWKRYVKAEYMGKSFHTFSRSRCVTLLAPPCVHNPEAPFNPYNCSIHTIIEEHTVITPVFPDDNPEE